MDSIGSGSRKSRENRLSELPLESAIVCYFASGRWKDLVLYGGSEDEREWSYCSVLDRVVDETHKLVSDRGYRPYIGESRRIGLRCQIMFITGTCPEELIAENCEEMVVLRPHILPEECFKPTFVYSVKVC